MASNWWTTPKYYANIGIVMGQLYLTAVNDRLAAVALIFPDGKIGRDHIICGLSSGADVDV